MTNKLIEFLHDPEIKGLILGNNGFRAVRASGGTVSIWYEGKEICTITPCDVQHELWVKPCLDKEQCERVTEVFALIGVSQLRLRYHARGASIQRLHNGRIESEMSVLDTTFLKVTI